MSKNLRTRFLIILGVMVACVAFAWPINKRINLGLDLKGGMHLILKVDTSKLADKAKEDAVLRAMEILRNRIDSMGVGETMIQRQGVDQILVQLPGVTDRNKAVDMVKRVAHLEFKLVESDTTKLKDAIAGTVPEGYELKYTKGEEKDAVLVKSEAVLQGDAVSDAKVDFDTSSMLPKISLEFNGKGAKEFGDLTSAHVGERLAIVMDNEVLSAPNVREAITSGTAEITGQFSVDEASVLALALRSGSLPAPMIIEEERTIGPLLGKDSIDAGIRATIYASIFVFLFMMAYYLIGGAIASFALLLNLGIIIGAMGFINVMLPQSQVTLTLPGIAGIILTLGMAVDANVLINERIREELANGRTLTAAIVSGYERAMSAIIDSNMTTIIAAVLLFYFGSGPIKGFAITLMIGLVASLFTAVYVTRAMFDYFLENRKLTTLKMLHLVKQPKLDFIKPMYFCLVFSAVLIVAGVYGIFVKKDMAFGVDFAGGQVQEYRFEKALSADSLRRVLKDAGINDAAIQQFDKNPQDVIVRSSEDTYEKVAAAFTASFKDNKFETLRIEKVGPVVGKALRERATWAMLLALCSILVYVWIRFKSFGFALGGVVALLHDMLMAVGIAVMMGRQIDLLVITALLTIAGYSINDTIVIFDRVRENIAKNRKMLLVDIINLSINQTLGRTILTSFVTLLVVFALFLFGGEVLNTFSLVLIIGFMFGIYSTMYIVTPFVLLFNKKGK